MLSQEPCTEVKVHTNLLSNRENFKKKGERPVWVIWTVLGLEQRGPRDAARRTENAPGENREHRCPPSKAVKYRERHIPSYDKIRGAEYLNRISKFSNF